MSASAVARRAAGLKGEIGGVAFDPASCALSISGTPAARTSLAG